MIGPSASEIIALRWRVRVVLRVLAVMLLIFALAWTFARMPEYAVQMTMNPERRYDRFETFYAPRFFSITWFGVPCIMSIAAVMTFLLAQFGLRLVVPAVPKPNCPGCGYDLREPSGDTCPECGLPLVRRANDLP